MAFLRSANPQLDDTSPLLVWRDGDPDSVQKPLLAAARIPRRMSLPTYPAPASLSLPAAGAVRVHPEPTALLQLRHEGPGRNRFDDPDAVYVVRYAASTLHGCLVETMARFRPHPDTETLLRSIENVDDDPAEPFYEDNRTGIGEWRHQQHVGFVRITSPAALIVDIEIAALLDHLDKHPASDQHSTIQALAPRSIPLDSTRASSGWAGRSEDRSRKPCHEPSTNGFPESAASGTGRGWIHPNAAGLSTTTSQWMSRSQLLTQ
jgi:hypothetical protein